MITSLFF